MDASILTTELPVSDSPGLSVFDDRLAEVSDLAGNGNFGEAAEQIQAMLEEGVCDLRLIGYFGFGVFLQQGVAALESLIVGYTAVLEDNWDAFGPTKKKEKAGAQALTWFAKQFVRKAEREESGNSPTYQGWADSVDTDEVDAISGKLRRLQGAMDEVLGEDGEGALESVSNLRRWVDSFRNVAKPPPSDEPQEEEVEEEEVEEEVTSDQAAGDGVAAPTGMMMTVHGSPHLAVFLRKLEAFATLVERASFKRALVIADDVAQTLEEFDPTLFFPNFFKTYAKMQALHANELIEFEHERDTPEWRALQMLYQVDIDEFVELEIE